ncbi:MAG TPA: DUF5916 domain-containing protein [Thermoanaerobaculia bacterium]|nr:DUF5916 domain-containing protein [Thermoanaerobaculia bacterium]
MNSVVVRPFALALALLAPLSLAAQEAPPAAPPPAAVEAKPPLPPPRQLRVQRATSEIEVDGALEERAWKDALTFDLAFEWSPGENVPPPVETDFLVTYDDQNLYVAWRAKDPKPAEIRAHYMDRDSIQTFIQDDHVVLMIDTFNDENRAYQLRVNPLGVQADSIFSQNEGVEDWSFDMIWASAGRITETGYTIEAAVPLGQLRFPRTAGEQTWGFDVGRSYPRSVRHRMTAHALDRSQQCILCQVTKVTGFEGIEPGRNLELDPTLTALRSDALGAGSLDGDLETGDEEVEAGLSVRWGITQNVTLNAAANPDFSQVEADVAQLDVNERFALFFPEKRPFFLEGADYFQTPIQAVFTRTVAAPDWGAKVTGKEGPNAFGVFLADDSAQGTLLLPSNQRTDLGFLDETVRTGVVRYRRDVGRGSNVGVIYTGREGERDYHNRLGGLDAFWRFDQSNTVRAQYLRSQSLYPLALALDTGQPLDEFEGDAFMVDYDHATRDWFWSGFYEQTEPGFRADAGFVPRVDVRRAEAVVVRQLWGEAGDWWNRASIGLFGGGVEDFDGRRTDEYLDLFANFAGPLQSFVELSLEENTQLVGETLHEGMNRAQLFGEIQPTGSVRFTLFADVGETVDFESNRRAEILHLAPAAEVKLGRHVNAKLDHTLRRLDVDETGEEIVEANLTQLRLIYNFNTRSFLRAIVQYLDLAPAGFESSEDLFTQLLFSYKLNPQTVLFLGYSDQRIGLGDLGLEQTGRTFFFKVGYAWLL